MVGTYISSKGLSESDLYYCNVDLTNMENVCSVSVSYSSSTDAYFYITGNGYISGYHFGPDDFMGLFTAGTIKADYSDEWDEYHNYSGVSVGYDFGISKDNTASNYKSARNGYIPNSVKNRCTYITIPIEVYSNNEDGYSSSNIGSITYKLRIADENKNFYDDNDNMIYQCGGIGLGSNLKDSSVPNRYSSFNVIVRYRQKDAFAMISYVEGSPFEAGPCSIVATLGALKGIELAHGFSDPSRYSHPLIGSRIGEGNNNTFSQWLSLDNVTISGEVYATYNDNSYILSRGITNLELTYNETIRLGYYIDKNNGRYVPRNKKGVNEYLSVLKHGDDWRYVVKESTTVHLDKSCAGDGCDREATYEEGYNEITSYILKGIPVVFGDNDFEWIGSYGSSTSGHAMLAVGTGITNDGVKEVIYDQGGGRYCAMPITDVRDYWLLDIKYQERCNSWFFSIPYWADVEY